ncbi:hypothetical protein B0H16DRAFT_1738772 [Mycena metata]|uniref:Uncharacterized protein n=1 Tax=Mycena metata TaxID=1033252 RepID=A0AAD7HGY1_9AGAR|nr:hypothetical protein B0H16DRAFT_1738772 [Mycena metata]
MPAPAVVGVYVLAAVGSIAAGLAFKEFVYEPHIAPRVERWAEEFLAKRQARRARRAVPVPADSAFGHGDDDAGTGTDAGDGKSAYELESLVENEVRQWRAQVGEGSGAGLRHRRRVPAPGTGSSSMAGSALDESNILIPYSPMSPTHVHVLFDPATDALSVADSHSVSGATSRVSTPSPHRGTGSSLLSRLTFRTPPPQQPAVGRAPPTPEPSVRGRGSPAPSLPRTPTPLTPAQTHTPAVEDPFSSAAFTSPHHVPSLSLSHPLDLDEQDVELLSAPSSSAPSEASAPDSRPESPFSELSRHSHSPFVLSPELRTFSPDARSPEFRTLSSMSSPAQSPFVLSSELGTFSPDTGLRTLSSDSESDLGEGDEAWSNAGSEVSASSWASLSAGRR